MARPPRPPSAHAGGLLTGRSRRIGPGQVSYRLEVSDHIIDLLYSGPKTPGIIEGINQAHRAMASELGVRARDNYLEARKRRPNKRRDARRHFKMEQAFRDMTGGGRPLKGRKGALGALTQGPGEGRGSPVFKSASGAKGIRGGTGFIVDFTALDTVVTNTESGGRSKNYPYWRSLEFGYNSFIADRPMFLTKRGRFDRPSSFTASAPRMPQHIRGAPFESVQIRGFAGYGMFQKAIQSVYSGSEGFTKQGSLWYYPDVLVQYRALPASWMQALEQIKGGAVVGRPGGRGQRRILFGADPRF